MGSSDSKRGDSGNGSSQWLPLKPGLIGSCDRERFSMEPSALGSTVSDRRLGDFSLSLSIRGDKC